MTTPSQALCASCPSPSPLPPGDPRSFFSYRRRSALLRCHVSTSSSNGAAAASPSPRRDSSSACQLATVRTDLVGVLGGASPRATLDFMRKVMDATSAQTDTDHIPMLVCSTPRPATCRTSNGRLEGAADSLSMQSIQSLLEERRFLEQAGAGCIVMPCHVAHLWFEEISTGCSVPFLHLADALVEELIAENLQPLEAGGRPKVGLLAAEQTLRAEFYQRRLRQAGFEVVLPDKATMEHAVIPGVEALQRQDMEGAQNLLRIAAQVLLVNAVNRVVLACHDMSSAFAPKDPTLSRCIDPMETLARQTVRWALQARKDAASRTAIETDLGR